MHASYILEKQKLFFPPDDDNSFTWWFFFCSTFDWNIRNGNEWYEYTNIPAGQISRLHVELHVLMILFFCQTRWSGDNLVAKFFFLFFSLFDIHNIGIPQYCVYDLVSSKSNQSKTMTITITTEAVKKKRQSKVESFFFFGHFVWRLLLLLLFNLCNFDHFFLWLKLNNFLSDGQSEIEREREHLITHTL